MSVETVDKAKLVVEKALSSIGDIATLPEVTIKIIEIVEEHLDTVATVPWARPGLAFHFASGMFFALPGGREAWTLDELRTGVSEIPLSSLYYHFHEARLRGDDDEDDFSSWLTNQLGRDDVALRLRAIDFYLFSLEELRQRVVGILAGEEEPT